MTTHAPDLVPDRTAMLLHLETVFGGAFDGALDGLVELTWSDAHPPHDVNRSEYFGTHQLEELADRAATLNRTPMVNVYIGAALRKPDTKGRSKDLHFHAAPFAWADIDEDVVTDAIARCREAGVMPHLTVVTGRHPFTRAHMWWRLAESARDPEAHRALCVAIQEAIGGDRNVVNPGRIMRLGGSIAWPVKEGRIVEQTEVHAPADGRPTAYWPRWISDRLPTTPLLLPPPSPSGTAPAMAPDIRSEPRNRFGLVIGSVSVEAALAGIRSGKDWHDNVLRLVGHWISRGLADAEILAMADSITLSGFTVDQTRQDLKRMIEGGRRKWNVPNPTHGIANKPPPSPLAIRWRDGASAAMIPRRRWIIGSFALRGQLTVLVSPPGAGKSTLMIAMAVAAATGRDEIIGERVHEQVKAWVWNNEDDEHELDRRLNAVMLRWNVTPADLRGRLGLNSGSERPLVVAKAMKDGSVVRLLDVDAIVEVIKAEAIGLLIVDPFVETHEVDENDNAQIKAVAALWREVARRGDCAVVIVHHTGKPPSASPDAWTGSLSASRGASSLSGVARVVRTLFGMSERDAEKLGIDAARRHQLVRMDDAKANLSLASHEARWFERKSITIANGEEVGVLVPVNPADASTTETADDRAERVREVILEQVAAAWSAWNRDQSRLPLSNQPQAPRERRIKVLIPHLTGCAASLAEATATGMIASGALVEADFVANKMTKRGLRPGKHDERKVP